MGDLAGHLGPGHLLADLGQLLLVGLEVPDHGVEAVDEGHHLVAGPVLDADLEIAQTDLPRPGEELAHGDDEQALDAAGEEDDQDEEEGPRRTRSLMISWVALFSCSFSKGKGERDEELGALGPGGHGQRLERVAAEPRPLDEEWPALVDEGLIGLPVEDLRQEAAVEELAPARGDEHAVCIEDDVVRQGRADPEGQVLRGGQVGRQLDALDDEEGLDQALGVARVDGGVLDETLREEAVEEVPREDGEEEHGHDGHGQEGGVDAVRERPQRLAERRLARGQGDGDDDDDDRGQAEEEEPQKVDGLGPEVLPRREEAVAAFAPFEEVGVIDCPALPERRPKGLGGRVQALDHFRGEPRGQLARIEERTAVEVEDLAAEIDLTQRRHGVGPEDLEVGVGRIEERQHLRVERDVEDDAAQANAGLGVIPVAHEEVLFLADEREGIADDGPLLGGREIGRAAQDLGDVEREPAQRVAFGVADLEARIPVGLRDGGLLPERLGEIIIVLGVLEEGDDLPLAPVETGQRLLDEKVPPGLLGQDGVADGRLDEAVGPGDAQTVDGAGQPQGGQDEAGDP